MNKRTISFALSLCLVLSLVMVPGPVFAGNSAKEIQLGCSGFSYGDKIYIGNYKEGGDTYQVPWRVIGKNGEVDTDPSNYSSAKTLFLLSEYTLGTSAFESSGNGNYEDSTLYLKMVAFSPNGNETLFTTTEGGLVSSSSISHYTNEGDQTVNDACLFPLSGTDGTSDANSPIDTEQAGDICPVASGLEDDLKTTEISGKLTGNEKVEADSWWLRSSLLTNVAYFVSINGGVTRQNVVNSFGVRPAFNMHLDSVLFKSAAANGKDSGALGDSEIFKKVDDMAGDEYKLTLSDTSRSSFEASRVGSGSLKAGEAIAITVSYENAQIGTDEFLSAMIVSGSGIVEYYGRFKNLTNAGDESGSQTITIPALSLGTYTLKVFNEAYNGDKQTDYASPFNDITLTVASKYDDAALSSLNYSVAGGTETAPPSFAPDTTTYNIVLPYGTAANASITLSAICRNQQAKINDGDNEGVILNGGIGTAIVKVTAEDNTTETYTLKFTTAAPPASNSGSYGSGGGG